VNGFRVATSLSAVLLATCGMGTSPAGVVVRRQAFGLDTLATGREWIVSFGGGQLEWQGADTLEARRPLGSGLWLVCTRASGRPVLEGVAWMERDAREPAPAQGWRGPGWLEESGAGGVRWGFDRIRTRQAWQATRGCQTVHVAVADSGIDGTHPDLVGRLVPGIDLVEGDGDTNDPNGHGTHVAGIIGATSDDGLGISGVAPGAMLMAVRVMDAQGEGTVAQVSERIIKAADMGVDVINLSIGSREGAQAKQAAIDHALAKGAVVVAAMGNSGSLQAFYPAANRGVNAVAATRQGDVLADYTNYGVWMTLVAPGTGILSTLPRGRWWPMSGTSMAAPHVSGVAALLRSLRPGLAAPRVAALLRAGADDLGPPGPDERHGAGQLNAAATLAALGSEVAAGLP
jgi:subtilisin family serine protease